MNTKMFSGLWMALVVVGAGNSLLAHRSFADEFGRKHPRRAQVVRREKRQQDKNNAAAVDGKITDKQAQHLDQEDRSIRRQERQDASQNGGHITKAEQNHLNREENSVNRQRNRDERVDAAAKSAPVAAPAAPAVPAMGQ